MEDEDEIVDLILGQLHPETPNMIDFKIIKKSGIDIPLGYDNEIIDKITHFEKLIERPNKKRNQHILTEKGVDVINEKGFYNYKEKIQIQLKLDNEKEELEFEKSKVDFILANKMLKEYPYTKWIARIGAFIGISLAILKLIEWLMKLK